MRPGGSGPRPNGPQSAVEVKSFSIPNRSVPGQIAPQALLQSAGGGGASQLQILRQLMAAFAPQGQQVGVPTLPGGPDTTSGWMNNEPNQGVPYDAGPGGYRQPNAPSDRPDTAPTIPPPNITPGATGPTPDTPPPPSTPPGGGLDLGSVMNPSPPPNQPWWMDKYEGGPDMQSLF